VLTAVILVKSTRDALTHLGPQLAGVTGVSEVYTVTGEWDFVPSFACASTTSSPTW
jgi:DNA-binding Lrp family transcriptional regulator